MSSAPGLDTAVLGHHPSLLLFDLEYTCWEDSMRTRWADPARPPEVLEIGAAGYDVQRGVVLATFSTFVRPTINPTLSSYCVDLLQLSQATIDEAPALAAAIAALRGWEADHALTMAPTCAWGSFDRTVLAADAARAGGVDPFHGRPHVDVQSVVRTLAGPGDRDAARAAWSLAANPARHRALADALDLIVFIDKARSTAGEPRRCAG